MINQRNLSAGLCLMLLAACGGSGSGGSQSSATSAPPPSVTLAALTVTDVEQVIAQGVAEAQARNTQATIAVVDRVGNVLAVYRMGAAAQRGVIIATSLDANGNALIHGGLEGIRLPTPAAPVNIDDQTAISKAITGAYLSSDGNAFSTRTASQIVQENFNPGQQLQPSGPLFGVQFSQFACSDFMGSSAGGSVTVGPQRSPLGLAADPGGFPLYKNGALVGGVGVMADGVYGYDPLPTDTVGSLDEVIAYAAAFNLAAPEAVQADMITLDGRTLRFSAVGDSDLASNPAQAPAFAALDPTVGSLLAVPGYFPGTIRGGAAFGDPSSGIRPDAGSDFPGQGAYVFVDASNTLRYPARSGTESTGALSEAEVLQLLRSALDVANETRGQIRMPLGSAARVTIAVVDSQGVPLGMAASPDAPVFGADVSLQKARTAAFFSSADAAAYLGALPLTRYLVVNSSGIQVSSLSPGTYVGAFQTFVGNTAALTDGQIAYSDRAIGNLSRPFYPDGINGAPPGPLSKPGGTWSLFSTGLQLDVSINAVLQHVLATAGAGLPDVVAGCTGVDLNSDLSGATRVNTDVRLGNGMQIFPGSVPIYRSGVLVGAIGVSGDGVDQDDMIAFLGLSQASTALGGAVGNAPTNRRADTLTPQGTRLLYVQCPQSPFLNSDAENVCQGL